MLDLKTRVHLHEEELVWPVGGDDELDRPRTRVVDAARRVASGRADAGPGRRVEQRRRRLLDDLLMAALQTALALTEVDDVAVSVRDDLDFDVSGVQHESLQKQRVVTECGGGLAARGDEGGRQLSGVVDHPHALAATAGGRLDQDGESDVGGPADEVVVGQPGPRDAGHHRHSEGRHGRLGGDLVAHGLDGRHRRTDEYDPGPLQRIGEFGVLREESVTGMDGLRAGATDRRRGSRRSTGSSAVAGAGPMRTATSASATCRAPASASLNTATERIPIARNVRMTRTAISPRLATRTVSKIGEVISVTS